MTFFKKLNFKQILIYCILISFAASGLFAIFRQNQAIARIGNRTISRTDLSKALGSNMSPTNEQTMAAYRELVQNMVLLYVMDTCGIYVSDHVTKEHIKTKYTKDEFQKLCKNFGSERLTYLHIQNDFITNFQKFIAKKFTLPASKVTQINQKIFTKKAAYYKYLDDEEHNEIAHFDAFNKMNNSDKRDFCIQYGFIKSPYIWYHTHFQNNIKCATCKNKKEKCNICLSNICMCNNCFHNQNDNITRDIAMSILMSPADQIKVYITPDNRILAIYVYDIDQNNKTYKNIESHLSYRLNELIYQYIYRLFIIE